MTQDPIDDLLAKDLGLALGAERLRLGESRQRSSAAVMRHIREAGRFAAHDRPRDDAAAIRTKRHTLRWASASVLATAACAALVASFLLPRSDGSTLRDSLQAEAPVPVTVQRSTTAPHPVGVIESAIDKARPGSTVLVPVGTRLTSADMPLRIRKPLTIKTAG